MSESNDSDCAHAGHFSWNELVTGDPSASADFYGNLFGWKAVPFSPEGRAPDAPPYTLFKVGDDGREVAGMIKPSQESPTLWVPYVIVNDVEVSVAKAAELGSAVLVPVMSIGEIGRIAILKDPQGAVIGLHELPK